jgi:hypothetical protein
MRSFIAILTAAFIGLAFAPTTASARPFGGGGFHGGGFHGGFHGGFRGGGFHRGFGFAPFVGAAVGLGIAGATYPYWGYPAGYYGYGDGCLTPRRIWTPYGWRIRGVNVCY